MTLQTGNGIAIAQVDGMRRKQAKREIPQADLGVPGGRITAEQGQFGFQGGDRLTMCSGKIEKETETIEGVGIGKAGDVCRRGSVEMLDIDVKVDLHVITRGKPCHRHRVRL